MPYPIHIYLLLLFSVLSSIYAEEPRFRGFKTFQPKPGVASEEPGGQLTQLLLDRKEMDGQDSYLIQVLFRGKPATAQTHRVHADRVEIDFYDTGKPAMRPARIRGGAVEASYMEELHYQDGKAVRRMVRLILYTRARPQIRFRTTLDRTLILFQLEAKNSYPAPKSPSHPDSGSGLGGKSR